MGRDEYEYTSNCELQVGTIKIGSGLIGSGHVLDSVSFSFRYTAGYTPATGQLKPAPTAR